MIHGEKSHNPIHVAAIVLVTLQVLYGLFWAGHDLSARLGLWPDPAIAQQFLSGLSWTQEFFFFGHVVLNCVVLWLVITKHHYALPVFTVSFLFDRIDWVMMTGNTAFNETFDVNGLTLASFSLQTLIFTMLAILAFAPRDETSPAAARRSKS